MNRYLKFETIIGGDQMTNRLIVMFCVALALIVPGTSTANSELMKLMDDPNNWATANGDYAATRYSK